MNIKNTDMGNRNLENKLWWIVVPSSDQDNQESILYYGSHPKVNRYIQNNQGDGSYGFDSYEKASEFYQKYIPKNNIQSHSSQEEKLFIYTDGSFSSKTKKAGWAYLLLSIEGIICREYGPLPGPAQTNNRAELYAILQALTKIQKILSKNFQENSEIYLFSDSQYAIQSITVWSKSWLKNGWKSSQGKPVKNKDLIVRILNLVSQMRIQFQHVRAHSGVVHNEIVDNLAKQGALL